MTVLLGTLSNPLYDARAKTLQLNATFLPAADKLSMKGGIANYMQAVSSLPERVLCRWHLRTGIVEFAFPGAKGSFSYHADKNLQEDPHGTNSEFYRLDCLHETVYWLGQNHIGQNVCMFLGMHCNDLRDGPWL